MSKLPVLLVALCAALPLRAAEAPKPTEGARVAAALQARLDALLKEGNGLALHPRYEALLAEASQAAEKHAAGPAAADLYRVMARGYEALGKHPEKDAAFARYIDALAARDKGRAAAVLQKEAERLIARRELYVAIKILELALAKFPDGPAAAAALYRLGTCHLWMNQYEPAEAALAEVIERWPASAPAVQARLRLARCYASSGKHASAVAVLERFVAEDRQSPERPAALFYLAVAQHLAGSYYPALLTYQQVAKEAPKSPYAPLARAALARLRGDVLRRVAHLRSSRAK